MNNKLFEAIYNNDKQQLRELFGAAGQYYQADEEINRDQIKGHLLTELNKLQKEFEKIIPTDPDTYKKYEDLNRALRGYH